MHVLMDGFGWIKSELKMLGVTNYLVQYHTLALGNGNGAHELAQVRKLETTHLSQACTPLVLSLAQ